MHRVALLLKSYADDVEYARRLVASLHRHNPEGLHLYCVVPAADIPLFADLASDTVTVMDEEPFARHLVSSPVAGLAPGYINQEIIKLAFHELGLAENYFCIDSDAEIVRDLAASDFLAVDGYPYTVLVEDNDLKADPVYYAQYWTQREPQLRLIAECVGLDDPVLRTCHGHQVFSSEVLRSFVADFLSPRGWDYRDALATAPYEFTWYNLWLQKSRAIPIHAREPLVKVFHHEGQFQEAVLRGITMVDLARSYLGVVVNANWARHLTSQDSFAAASTKPERLAPHLSYGEVAALLAAKVKDTARRRSGSTR